MHASKSCNWNPTQENEINLEAVVNTYEEIIQNTEE